MTAYATPRRLAVSISHVLAKAEGQRFKQKILPLSIAYDAGGTPTAALTKKLAALGIADASTLTREFDGKAEALFHEATKAGLALSAALQETLDDVISKLPIPKVMSYQRPDGTTVKFARPRTDWWHCTERTSLWCRRSALMPNA